MRTRLFLLSLLLAICFLPVGCSDDDDDDKTIVGPNPPNPAPTATFVASTSSGLAPISVTFTPNVTGTVTSYKWTFGDGTTSTSPTPSHVFTKAGAYSVTLTVTGPSGTSSYTRSRVVLVDEIRDVIGTWNLGTFWPSRVQGDCDFQGHGPLVTAHWKIYKNPGNARQLIASLHFTAQETTSDWTTGQLIRIIPLLTLGATSGLTIKEVYAPSQADFQYTDTDHAAETYTAPGFASFTVVGDTDGSDICGTTSNDTRISVVLYRYKCRVGP